MGCRVQVFSLILDSSVGLSVGIKSAGDLVSETLMGSNPAFIRGRQLVSFRFEYRLPVPEHRNQQQQTCMYVCMYVCMPICIYIYIQNPKLSWVIDKLVVFCTENATKLFNKAHIHSLFTYTFHGLWPAWNQPVHMMWKQLQIPNNVVFACLKSQKMDWASPWLTMWNNIILIECSSNRIVQDGWKLYFSATTIDTLKSLIHSMFILLQNWGECNPCILV